MQSTMLKVVMVFLVLSCLFATLAYAGEGEYTVNGLSPSEYFVIEGGDIDGDEWMDVLVSVPEYDATGENAGAVFLFLGKNLNDTLNFKISDADYAIYGDSAGDFLGSSADFVFDENGDGLDEVEMTVADETRTVSSVELGAYAQKNTLPRTAVVGVSVGLSENLDCSLNTTKKNAAAVSSMNILVMIAMAGYGFFRWATYKSL